MVISFLLKECCFHPHFPQIPHSVSENSAFYNCYWIRVRGRGNLKRKMRGKGSSKVRKKCKKEKKKTGWKGMKKPNFCCQRYTQHIQAAGCHWRVCNVIWKSPMPSIIGLCHATPALIGEMLAWIGKTLNENAYSSCPSLSLSPNLLLLHNFFAHSPLIIF